MKNILTLLCILAFAPAAFAGGTMLFTRTQSPYAQNNGQYQNNTTGRYNSNSTLYTDGSQQTGNGNLKTTSTKVTKETSYEKRYKAGHEGTYRTRQDKYYNYGGAKFGTGFSSNGTTGRW